MISIKQQDIIISPFLRQLRDEVEANKGVALIEYKEF